MTPTSKDKKEKTFADFKKFLAETCFDTRIYALGKYDLKIYNWFKKNKDL